jgi:hypothetical protein
MPNRIIREGILTSEKFEKLSWPEEVFYRRIMSVVDDYGRYYAKPALLRAACYPLLLQKVSDSDIEKWLTACVNSALVRVYPAKDGKRYLEINDFRQQVRSNASKFPAYDEQMHSSCVADATHMISNAHLDVDVDVDVDVSVKAPKGAVVDAVIPSGLDTADFREAWAQWGEHLKQKKTKRTPLAAEMQLKKLVELGPHGAIAAIRHSIAGNYQGIYEPRTGFGTPKPDSTPRKPDGSIDYYADAVAVFGEESVVRVAAV